MNDMERELTTERLAELRQACITSGSTEAVENWNRCVKAMTRKE